MAGRVDDFGERNSVSSQLALDNYYNGAADANNSTAELTACDQALTWLINKDG